jgi:hypothetical protein
MSGVNLIEEFTRAPAPMRLNDPYWRWSRRRGPCPASHVRADLAGGCGAVLRTFLSEVGRV